MSGREATGMECPNCKLLVSAGTQRCECGYDFGAGRRTERAPAPPPLLPGLSDEALAYNPDEIDDCTDRLYSQANAVITSATIAGVIGGALLLALVGA
ncbi:unnamed protein product, partial [marine sediment metagenome]